mgnify:CR=1 FL=1
MRGYPVDAVYLLLSLKSTYIDAGCRQYVERSRFRSSFVAVLLELCVLLLLSRVMHVDAVCS